MLVAARPCTPRCCWRVVMICLAVLYAVQDAPFLGAVQIIVYTGAILMLFLFVLMLVGVDASDSLVETIRGPAAAGGRSSACCFGVVAGRRRRPGRARHGRSGSTTANADGNVAGARATAVHPLRLRLRGHHRAADHRRARRDGARPPRAAHAQADPARPGRAADARLRRARQAPRSAAAPGVYARHNAVDTPALLPDGTPSPSSVSRVLAGRAARSAPCPGRA